MLIAPDPHRALMVGAHNPARRRVSGAGAGASCAGHRGQVERVQRGGAMQIPEESIDVARDVHEVFAFVSDVTNDVKWHTTVVEVRRVSDGPIGLGSRFEVTYDAHRHSLDTPPDPSRFQPLVATLTEFVPDRALRGHIESVKPPRGIGARVLGRAYDLTFRFEPVPGGTRVYRGGEIQPVALVRPLLPLFMRANAGRNRYLLGNLKRSIEAEA